MKQKQSDQNFTQQDQFQFTKVPHTSRKPSTDDLTHLFRYLQSSTHDQDNSVIVIKEWLQHLAVLHDKIQYTDKIEILAYGLEVFKISKNQFIKQLLLQFLENLMIQANLTLAAIIRIFSILRQKVPKKTINIMDTANSISVIWHFCFSVLQKILQSNTITYCQEIIESFYLKICNGQFDQRQFTQLLSSVVVCLQSRNFPISIMILNCLTKMLQRQFQIQYSNKAKPFHGICNIETLVNLSFHLIKAHRASIAFEINSHASQQQLCAYCKEILKENEAVKGIYIGVGQDNSYHISICQQCSAGNGVFTLLTSIIINSHWKDNFEIKSLNVLQKIIKTVMIQSIKNVKVKLEKQSNWNNITKYQHPSQIALDNLDANFPVSVINRIVFKLYEEHPIYSIKRIVIQLLSMIIIASNKNSAQQRKKTLKCLKNKINGLFEEDDLPIQYQCFQAKFVQLIKNRINDVSQQVSLASIQLLFSLLFAKPVKETISSINLLQVLFHNEKIMRNERILSVCIKRFIQLLKHNHEFMNIQEVIQSFYCMINCYNTEKPKCLKALKQYLQKVRTKRSKDYIQVFKQCLSNYQVDFVVSIFASQRLLIKSLQTQTCEIFQMNNKDRQPQVLISDKNVKKLKSISNYLLKSQPGLPCKDIASIRQFFYSLMNFCQHLKCNSLYHLMLYSLLTYRKFSVRNCIQQLKSIKKYIEEMAFEINSEDQFISLKLLARINDVFDTHELTLAANQNSVSNQINKLKECSTKILQSDLFKSLYLITFLTLEMETIRNQDLNHFQPPQNSKVQISQLICKKNILSVTIQAYSYLCYLLQLQQMNQFSPILFTLLGSFWSHHPQTLVISKQIILKHISNQIITQDLSINLCKAIYQYVNNKTGQSFKVQKLSSITPIFMKCCEKMFRQIIILSDNTEILILFYKILQVLLKAGLVGVYQANKYIYVGLSLGQKLDLNDVLKCAYSSQLKQLVINHLESLKYLKNIYQLKKYNIQVSRSNLLSLRSFTTISKKKAQNPKTYNYIVFMKTVEMMNNNFYHLFQQQKQFFLFVIILLVNSTYEIPQQIQILVELFQNIQNRYYLLLIKQLQNQNSHQHQSYARKLSNNKILIQTICLINCLKFLIQKNSDISYPFEKITTFTRQMPITNQSLTNLEILDKLQDIPIKQLTRQLIYLHEIYYEDQGTQNSCSISTNSQQQYTTKTVPVRGKVKTKIENKLKTKAKLEEKPIKQGSYNLRTRRRPNDIQYQQNAF